jgi:hypothetical protein
MKSLGIIKIFIAIPMIIACNMSSANHNETANMKDTSNKSFAVLELFTSEGCSSCPPADAVLAKLSEEYKGNVYALGFHVDYWNRLGWIDSFSNADYSKRQGDYAKQFRLNSIYTPQLVINGKTELVGSDERKARTLLAKELENTVVQSIQLNAKQNESGITVSYDVDKGVNEVLNVALVQLQAKTNVKNGENGGHVLSHINIVRDFQTIEVDKSNSGNVTLNIPKGSVEKDCSVIAYLQDKTDLIIKGVTEVAIQ